MIESVFDLILGEAIFRRYLLVGVPVWIRTGSLALETIYMDFGIINGLTSLHSWYLMMTDKAQHALLGHVVEFLDFFYGIVVVKVYLLNEVGKL